MLIYLLFKSFSLEILIFKNCSTNTLNINIFFSKEINKRSAR